MLLMLRAVAPPPTKVIFKQTVLRLPTELLVLSCCDAHRVLLSDRKFSHRMYFILPEDTLAERLRRRPAKPMGSPRVGSNPTGVAFVSLQMNDLCSRWSQLCCPQLFFSQCAMHCSGVLKLSYCILHIIHCKRCVSRLRLYERVYTK